jgi:membrane-associated phospholipid phosphatase
LYCPPSAALRPPETFGSGRPFQDTPGGAVLAGIAVALAFPGVQFVVWFAGLLAAIRTRNLPLVVAAFLVVIALGVNPLLKELIARPRPNADELIIRRAASGYGFPSGHTQDATQIYGLQPSRLPRSAACSGRAL